MDLSSRAAVTVIQVTKIIFDSSGADFDTYQTYCFACVDPLAA